MPEETRATGPLRPIELATASVMAGVTVALTVIGWFLPHLGAVAALSVVPLGVVSHRHRFRALAAATFAASVLSFLVAGTGTVSNVVECAIVGGLVGAGLRRRWSFARVISLVALVAPVLAALSVGLLEIFSSIRRLTLRQISNTWKGFEKVLHGIPQLSPVLHRLDGVVTAALRDWWVTVGVLVIAATLWFALLAWVLLRPVLARLDWVKSADRLEGALGGAAAASNGSAPPSPVPVSLRGVRFRYPGAGSDALAGVSLELPAGEFAVLVGDNGSGKSTLARILAGRPPTAGTVLRQGGAGLGLRGGTAMVMQHPETQVLGVRVADDVVWGLHEASDVDVGRLLRDVGLEGMERRETSTLSGGELQRLAVAAALARRPRLLISDESTSMVDAEGRRLLVGLLRELPATRGMTVMHVTHRVEEAAGADRVFQMKAGSLVGPAPADARPAPAGGRPAPAGNGLPAGSPGGAFELAGVFHTYAAGTPWAQPALRDVDLVIGPGEGVLITGDNGSGKSTLAWVLAGVLRPTGGVCLLGGRPVHEQVGEVGLAFQHARLQLQRSTVEADLLAAGARDEEAAAAALAAVGLDPASFAKRGIDQLSGGEQRRVVLAGILARRPAALVLDEPLAGLDIPGQESLIGLLTRLRFEWGLTVVVISHDLDGLGSVCDRRVLLDAGRIVSDVRQEEAAGC